MFETATKADAGPAAGLARLRAVRAAPPRPLVAIGGITAERAPALYAAGADGVCVGSANPAGRRPACHRAPVHGCWRRRQFCAAPKPIGNRSRGDRERLGTAEEETVAPAEGGGR